MAGTGVPDSYIEEWKTMHRTPGKLLCFGGISPG